MSNNLALQRPARPVSRNSPVRQALSTAVDGVIRFGGKEYKLPKESSAQEKFVVALMKTGKPPVSQRRQFRRR